MDDIDNLSRPISRRTAILGTAALGITASLTEPMYGLASASASVVPAFSVANQKFSRPITPAYLSANGGWNDSASPRTQPHCGQDYTGGEVVMAAASGWIREITENTGSYGYSVTMEHPNSMWSFYAHMAEKSPLVEGHWYSRGAALGTVGGTGGSITYDVHCHLAIADSKNNLTDRDSSGALSTDPEAYIKKCAVFDDPTPPVPVDEDPMPASFVKNYTVSQAIGSDWRTLNYDSAATTIIASTASFVSGTVHLTINGLTAGERVSGRFIATDGVNTRSFGTVTFEGASTTATQYFETSINASLQNNELLRFQARTSSASTVLSEFRVHALYW